MLRLLAQRGEQGYDDLASLTGQSVDEVRAKVIGALAQLEAEGEPVPDIPLPAAAKPEAPAAPVEPAPPVAAAPEPEEPVAPVEPTPPAAEPPPAPPPPPPAEPASPTAAAPKATGPGRPKLSLPEDRGVRAAIGAGLLAIVAIVVILIVGGSGGSGDSEPSASGSGETGSANVSENSELTEATLSPVEGGSGEGRAIFGRVKKNVVLQVEAKGLEPSPKGSAYTIWLYKSPKLALRVGAVRVDQNGTIAVQLPLPTELLAYVASGAFDQIDIALTEDAAYAAEVTKSKKEKRLPEHVGTSVLRGEITGPAIKPAASGG